MTSYSATFVWSVLYMCDGMPRCFTKNVWLNIDWGETHVAVAWLRKDAREPAAGEKAAYTPIQTQIWKAVRKNIPPQHIHAWVFWSTPHLWSCCMASFEFLLLSESVMFNTCWAALLNSLLSLALTVSGRLDDWAACPNALHVENPAILAHWVATGKRMKLIIMSAKIYSAQSTHCPRAFRRNQQKDLDFNLRKDSLSCRHAASTQPTAVNMSTSYHTLKRTGRRGDDSSDCDGFQHGLWNHWWNSCNKNEQSEDLDLEITSIGHVHWGYRDSIL